MAIDPISRIPNGQRRKLTREELLAGKCFPDDGADPDPRIKSPDDLLQLKAPNANQVYSEELTRWKERYNREIGQWKEYERRVKDWKDQVLLIVRDLKREAETKQSLVEEIKKFRAQLQAKDEEIARLRRGAGASPSPDTKSRNYR